MTILEKAKYIVKAETGPHQYSEMTIEADSPEQAEKIFRLSHRYPMGLTISKKEAVD